MQSLRLLVAAVAALALAAPARARVGTLRVANYNVENLYDAVVDQPTNNLTGAPGDADWCRTSWRRWTEERYRTKLGRLAWVIDRMKPDILVVEEVENLGTVQALADRVRADYGWTLPHIAHHDSTDPRGIDVAILSRYPVRSVEYKPRRWRRGLLVAEIEVDGTRVVVLANHWKSQIGDAEENIDIRTSEAAETRSEILRRLRFDPNATILSLGDYNEDMDGPSMMAGLKPANDRGTALASIRGPLSELRPYNVVGDIPKSARGSFFYARRKVWNTFDGIHVVPRMLLPLWRPGPAWRVGKPSETITFHPPEMRWGDDGRPKSYRRSRQYEAGTDGDEVSEENYYSDGYSDHFPVLTVLHRAAEPDAAKDAEDDAGKGRAAEEAEARPADPEAA